MEFGNNRADFIDPEYLNLQYISMKVGSYTSAYKWNPLLLQTPIGMEVTHKVDRSEASMTNLPQVCEELLGVVPEEQLSHLRVLQAPGPHTRRHGQRLDSMDETDRVRFLFLTHATNICVVENVNKLLLWSIM